MYGKPGCMSRVKASYQQGKLQVQSLLDVHRSNQWVPSCMQAMQSDIDYCTPSLMAAAAAGTELMLLILPFCWSLVCRW